MIIKSNKGTDMFVYNNYIYNIGRIGINRILWRCVKSACRGTAYTMLNYKDNLRDFHVEREHDHEPSTNEILKKKYLNEMKNTMMLTNGAPRNIVSTVLRGCDASTLQCVGKRETIYKNLRNYRRSVINPKPYIYDVIKIGDVLSRTHTNQIFYRFGPDNLNGLEFCSDILIFYSHLQIENLKRNDVWSVDGTFQVVPKPWFQLFTISYLSNNQVVPSIFVILKNKKQSTYERMYNILKSFNSDLAPATVISDFEYSSIKAITNSFTDVKLRCCQFHLGQSIIRKTKELNLYIDYLNNATTKKFIRSLIGLSYVQANHTRQTFFDLKNHSDFPTTLNSIYDYFYNNYIGDVNTIVRFPMPTWHLGCSFDANIPKTNNGIEGWHNAFKNTFGTSIYSFELLIAKLKDEEETVRQKVIRIGLGEQQIRKKKYVLMEDDLNLFLRNTNTSYGTAFVFALITKLFY